MFKKRTVFVVGAGASAELGLPIGAALADKITAKMDIQFERGFQPAGGGDYDLYSQLTHVHRQHAAQLQFAAWRIRDGLPLVAQSIDDFLDQNRTDQLVNLYGKAAIVRTIAEAERDSVLYFNPMKSENHFDDKKLVTTWIKRFMHMLCRGLPREDVKGVFDQVSFIVFNYDRCIEHFLIHALQRGYAVGNAAELVDGLDIIHPYGSIGDLKDVPFGHGGLDYASLSQRIRTYTEQAASDARSKISNMMAQAQQVIFLGFAYYDQNMAMLSPSKPFSDGVDVFGTAYGMSNSDVEVVSTQITGWFSNPGYASTPGRIRIEQEKCADLFDFYTKSFTA
jgi:hypothetical protein